MYLAKGGAELDWTGLELDTQQPSTSTGITSTEAHSFTHFESGAICVCLAVGGGGGRGGNPTPGAKNLSFFFPPSLLYFLFPFLRRTGQTTHRKKQKGIQQGTRHNLYIITLVRLTISVTINHQSINHRSLEKSGKEAAGIQSITSGHHIPIYPIYLILIKLSFYFLYTRQRILEELQKTQKTLSILVISHIISYYIKS